RAGHGYSHQLTALVLRRRSSSTPWTRVKTSACGQNWEHDRAADRVDETEELGLLEPVDEQRVQTQEGRDEPEAPEEQQVGPVHPTLGRPSAKAPPVRD